MPDTPSIYDVDWFTDANKLGKKEGLGTRNTPQMQQALALIQDFLKRGGTGRFKLLDRGKIAAGLSSRVSDPDSFVQGETWLCGIATVVRVWAFDHPVEFARLGIDLFEKGAGTMQGHDKYSAKQIRPSDALKASPPAKVQDKKGAPEMDHGDWIVLASVREAFNDVFDYTSNEGIFHIKAWNLASDVEREFKTLGYSRIVNKTSPVQLAGYNSLMEASDLYDQDWRVILLVNMRILDEKDLGVHDVINHSDHWIGLNSTITVSLFGNRQMVWPFKVYSWNGAYSIPRWDKPVSLQAILNSYFGYVAGQY